VAQHPVPVPPRFGHDTAAPTVAQAERDDRGERDRQADREADGPGHDDASRQTDDGANAVPRLGGPESRRFGADRGTLKLRPVLCYRVRNQPHQFDGTVRLLLDGAMHAWHVECHDDPIVVVDDVERVGLILTAGHGGVPRGGHRSTPLYRRQRSCAAIRS
jgi:hypothetical protein